jgi:hypothetical protein
MPGVTVRMSGDEVWRELFLSFTRRHGRVKVIQNKRRGVALLEIPERFTTNSDTTSRNTSGGSSTVPAALA